MTPVPPSLGFVEGVAQPLEKRFEVIKDVGDGSFGSVVLARVRGTRNTVAIKSMKKSFDSFSECLRLREVQSLRAIPRHAHIVPVLDAFLDPVTHKLHLVMELMEINLYQFLKSRDNKPLDPKIVQVILWQVVAALQHIHAHGFFHRDIKPENVLMSILPSNPPAQTQNRLYTPPQTPPSKFTPATSYLVKLADFGLAREIRSRPPYTSYVSTRWYRAPEVLLRAEEYSAPVDIWAMGAMAIEVATLRPIFPGTNEIDQLWRVCEVMGTPSEWYTTEERTGRKVKIGGGAWSTGLKLASTLAFKFPNVPPMDMTNILTSPWPRSLADFVVACLAWDPKKRPTSTQCLQHEFFRDVEKYLPIRDPIPTVPATLSPGSSAGVVRKPSLKGLGIDIPKTQKQPSYTNVPYPQDSPQQGKSGWFQRREKKRDSLSSQPPAQAPQLPLINLGGGPPGPAVAPKLVPPGVTTNGGMAFSPQKGSRPSHDRTISYPRDDHGSPTIPMPSSLNPPPPVVPPKVPVEKVMFSPSQAQQQQIQVPGYQSVKPPSIPPVAPSLGALPTIRPSSPLLGEVFSDTFNVNRRHLKLEEAPRLESPKRDKSPVRPPVVNTFLLQAQQLEREEKEKQNVLSGQSTKVGRQLSAASTAASMKPDKAVSPTGSVDDEMLSNGKPGFFSHFRKRARKRISVNGEEGSPDSSSMPISPLPQLRPINFGGGGGDKSLRNSVVMEDFYEDAQEDLETDLMRTMKEIDYAMAAGYRPPANHHITIAPSATNKNQSSHPPSSHKLGVAIPSIIPVKNTATASATRYIPSPYPNVLNSSPPKLPPLTIPKRASSRALTTKGSDVELKSRRPQASPLPQIMDDGTTIPGAYPISSSPDVVSALDKRGSIALSRDTTNLSLSLPGAYPKERRGSRYNSSSSGLSSAASYQTAFDPETWDTEEQKQREEQLALQQSLMEATRAMRALEKHPYTDWTETSGAGNKGWEKCDMMDENTLMGSPPAGATNAWPTPPYIENDDGRRGAQGKVVQVPIPPIPPRTRDQYFGMKS